MIIVKILGFIVGGALVIFGGFSLLIRVIDYFSVALSFLLWSGLVALGVVIINACIALA